MLFSGLGSIRLPTILFIIPYSIWISNYYLKKRRRSSWTKSMSYGIISKHF